MRFFTIALFLVPIGQPALAAATVWQDIAPGVRARMISSDARDSQGRTLVGLEIDMPETHKTYWHTPGETGIPTTIDFSRAVEFSQPQMHWPSPTIETRDGLVDFVYRGPTILPVEGVVMGGNAALIAAVTLGICAEICIPVQAEFNLPLSFTEPDRGNGLRLQQALALAPIAWSELPAPVGAVRLSSGGAMLAVDLEGQELDAESLIASMPGGDVLFGAPQKSPEANLVHVPVLSGATGQDLVGRTLELEFQTPNGAYSLSRVIEASAS